MQLFLAVEGQGQTLATRKSGNKAPKNTKNTMYQEIS